jgi:hypothetical protein
MSSSKRKLDDEAQRRPDPSKGDFVERRSGMFPGKEANAGVIRDIRKSSDLGVLVQPREAPQVTYAAR